jgi:geranylgeranyl diphosphate synthase type II
MHTSVEQSLQEALRVFLRQHPADGIYAPIHDLLQSGGKRIRPQMVLASAQACGGSVDSAMPAALAVELFHNFTLIHDDIMDEAPLRRGRPTAYATWGRDAAILSGDALHAMACEALLDAPSENLRPLLQRFLRTAIEVCEGQQLDIEFESRERVSVDEYLEMIRLKTAVLLAAALAMGALSAGAQAPVVDGLYAFGLHLGTAFQLQDDLLDAFGDPAQFGKQLGGDILADKKTFLLIRALELEPELVDLAFDSTQQQEKVEHFTAAFIRLGVDVELARLLRQEVALAEAALEQITPDLQAYHQGNSGGLTFLRALAENIATRTA